MQKNDQIDPILDSTNFRMTFYPIKYRDIYDEYKTQLASIWTIEEVDLSEDRDHWEEKLTTDERYFISNILAFFASSDNIVNINLVENFINDVKIPEAQVAYRFQAAMEDIHAESYSLMIDTFIRNNDEKNKLFNAITTIPCVKKKAKWAFKWINDKKAPYSIRLIAFAIIEGIFFSGSFCAIYWLRNRGLMPGLCKFNDFIARDEGKHTDFACLIYNNYINNKVDTDIVHQVFKEAVEIEKEFITESIPCNMIGMNKELMCQYIEYVADRLLGKLNLPPIYNSENPFEFMIYISLQGKSNFFESRPTEYQNAHVLNQNKSFTLEEDF